MQTNNAQREDAEIESCLELLEVDPCYVEIGEVVAGKYRVEQVLGVGGMAFVLAVEHVTLHERFALKFLNEQFLLDPQVKERFTQEAMAACRLRSEHIARVYDVGVHQGAPFLVMEHLRGRDLSTVLHQSGPLPIESAVEWAMQACDALATAHRHGIVHRDIKPENLFLVEHEGLPSIKLLDFGISKIALAGGAPASRLTDDLSLGTPCYMAPEHIRSTAAADAQSDLWSLGAVLYELLAGVEAFRGPTVTEVCAAVLETTPPSLTELRPDIPVELADVVARCLEKDPVDRFANVAELAAALLPFAPPRAIVSVERASSLMRIAAAASDPHVSSIRTSSKPRALAKTPRPTRRTHYRTAIVASVLVALAGGGVALRTVRGPTATLPPAAAPAIPPVTPDPASETASTTGAMLALAPAVARDGDVPAKPEPKAATRSVRSVESSPGAASPRAAKPAAVAHASSAASPAAVAAVKPQAAAASVAIAEPPKAPPTASPAATVELGY